MPLNKNFVGREYPFDEPYEVSRELIRRFAAAIGDDNPAYTDVEAAKALGHPDVVAPPTFLTILGFRYRDRDVVSDPDLGLNYAMIVHGEQKFVHHRPVRAGDLLRVTQRVEDIRVVGRNEIMTTKQIVTTDAGEAVADIVVTLVSRGTAEGAAS